MSDARVCEWCGTPLRARKKGESYRRWEAMRYCSTVCKNHSRAVVWSVEELLKRVTVSPDGCWLWDQSVNVGGYACACIKGSVVSMHRVAYSLAAGEIAEGLVIDHVCHNRDLTCLGGPTCQHRRCVNPDHLEAITHSENVRRGRTVSRTHCRNGHLVSENTYEPPEGGRRCRACMTVKQRAYRARLREAS